MAINNFNDCKQTALNNWKSCVSIALAGLGGALACVLGGLKFGMGIPAIKLGLRHFSR